MGGNLRAISAGLKEGCHGGEAAGGRELILVARTATR
jgi:hypothetical protein